MTEDEIHRLVDVGDGDGLRAALDGGADAFAIDALGDTLLSRAAAAGRLDVVDLLLSRDVPADHAGPSGNSPLMAAAAAGHVAIVQRLLRAGADPEHANKWGFTAKDWAAWPENAAEVSALMRENLK